MNRDTLNKLNEMRWPKNLKEEENALNEFSMKRECAK